VSVPPVDVTALGAGTPGESSAAARCRVTAARERQRQRFERALVSVARNAELSAAELDRVGGLDAKARTLLESAVHQLSLSARAFVRVRRVARSIADLEGCDDVSAGHIAEAIQGRLLDRPQLS
jgi:magnesium chelatase family protein